MFDLTNFGPALLAAFFALLVEAVEAPIIVLALGPLLSLNPIGPLQPVVGTLRVRFGMRWLRKAIRRAAGLVDPIAVATTFKAALLEGIEVVFIVAAVGIVGSDRWRTCRRWSASGDPCKSEWYRLG